MEDGNYNNAYQHKQSDYANANAKPNIADSDLIDFMVNQYGTQSNMAKALKLGESAISQWRVKGLPNAWRLYFTCQWDKKGSK